MTRSGAPEYCYGWEYDVPAQAVAAFEEAYGDRGPWVRLFRRDDAYVGTTLLRDQRRPGRYLTFDYWRTRAAFEAFRERFRDEFAAIDAACERLTASERPVGEYDPLTLLLPLP